MTFLSPNSLFFLFALIIPIIIHLFNFRKYTTVLFSNVAFLKNIKTESERKSKLKHLLVLISRLLAFACIILAFAKPIILNNSTEKTASDVTIYIDNSLSLEAKNENGNLLEQSKLLAIELVNQFNDVRFTLITNDFLGKHTHNFSKAQAVKEIEQISYSPISRSFEQVTNRWQQLSASSSLYVVSDFEKNLDIQIDKLTTNETILLLPIKTSAKNNVYIDSIWFESPNHVKHSEETLFVKLKNNHSDDVECRLDLELNNTNKGFANVEIESENEKIVTFNYSNQAFDKYIKGKLSLTDYENPQLLFDDEFYFSYPIKTSSNVAIIYEDETKTPIEKVYRTDSTYKVTQHSFLNLNYDDLSKSDLIVLNEIQTIPNGLASQIISFAEQGTSIAIVPHPKSDVNSYNLLLSKFNAPILGSSDTSLVKLKPIEFKNPFFKGIFTETNDKIDLPKVAHKFYAKPSINSNSESILEFDSGNHFLSKTKTSKGNVWLFSFPFSEERNQFKNHALFVPVMLRIAELSSNQQALYFIVGNSDKINLSADEISENINIEISNEVATKKFIPKFQQTGKNIFVETTNDVDNSGFWTLTHNNYSTPLSFNFNRSESAQNYYSEKDLIDFTTSQQNLNIKLFSINNTSELKKIIKGEIGKSLWGYFIFASLLFFLIEILLLRLLK
ncbi:MAG: BatA domain-containing protein [Bacteroidia bacterium]